MLDDISSEDIATSTLPKTFSARVKENVCELEKDECVQTDEPGGETLPRTFSAKVEENLRKLNEGKSSLSDLDDIADDSVIESREAKVRFKSRQKLVDHVRCHAPGNEVSMQERKCCV